MRYLCISSRGASEKLHFTANFTHECDDILMFMFFKYSLTQTRINNMFYCKGKNSSFDLSS